MGEWGTGTTAQRDVAAAMNRWAGSNRAQFILSTGDNFYDGITGNNDRRWNTWWRNIYDGANIRNLPWYISVGNHDYRPYGSGRIKVLLFIRYLHESFNQQISVLFIFKSLPTQGYRKGGEGKVCKPYVSAPPPQK